MSSGYFIATACYGSYDAPEVMVLRQFRDEVLMKRAIGKGFVQFYYVISPPLASVVSRRFVLKKWIRVCIIEPIVTVAKRFQKSY